MRSYLVAGNWKMNLDLTAARALVRELREGLASRPAVPQRVEVAICPAFIYLFPIAKAVDGCPIDFGAQDLYPEPAGAYTGEVSAAMVAETGARYVILGHSERRHVISHLEDDWLIHRKLIAALDAKLTPILCVGETLAERDAGKTLDVLTFQLTAATVGLRADAIRRLIIAYEPVWAIGTGRNATPQQAQEAHRHLRTLLAERFGTDAADAVRILYGGSLKPDNAGEIFAQPDVDGGLVGGASLKSDSFLGIIDAAIAAAS